MSLAKVKQWEVRNLLLGPTDENRNLINISKDDSSYVELQFRLSLQGIVMIMHITRNIKNIGSMQNIYILYYLIRKVEPDISTFIRFIQDDACEG